MSWQESDRMSLRLEFVTLAGVEGANVRELCRRYGISPKTGYKWLDRYKKEGVSGLEDRSRRQHRSPKRTSAEVEASVVAVRQEHPWGGRKIRDRLLKLGQVIVPPSSTITEILRRHGSLDAQESDKHRAFCRFEREEPNEIGRWTSRSSLARGRR
ncbi:MAG TPA: helix-turn-helix domain-containing protein [Thermoanaerobaculia bacterium]|jgi:transposase|nr:helix-turn-helix domain-containing protein [Thermoanaerobaculia bacterium]